MSCDPTMRLTAPSPDILSLFLSSSAYTLSLIVSYLLFPHYIIVLTHNTLIPPHASRRRAWESLEADKANVESRDTHYRFFAKQGDSDRNQD